MGKIITTEESRRYERVSRWIKINSKVVTPRSRFYNDCNKGDVLIFRFLGCTYDIENITSMSYPEFWEDEDGNLNYFSGVLAISNTIAFVVEMDDCGEYIRFYKQVED